MQTFCMILNIRKYFFLVAAMPFLLMAQPRMERTNSNSAGLTMIFEPAYVLSEDGNHQLTIFYRIRYDKLVFVRTIENNKAVFKGNGELQIELLDSNNVSFSRKFVPLNLKAEDNSIQHLRNFFLQGFVTFALPSGKWTAFYRFEDKEAKENGAPSDRETPPMRLAKDEFTIPKYSTTTITSSVFLTSSARNSFPFELFNLGKDILFSSDCRFVFTTKNTLQKKEVSASLISLISPSEKNIIFKDSIFTLNETTSSSIQFQTTANNITLESINGSLNIVSFAFTSKKLRQGRYELTLKNNSDSILLAIPFSTRWIDMPQSLADLDLAIEVLQYITTKDEYSQINSGRRSKKIEAFTSFWQKKDPTPETAYNEVMAEFYRRVDFSIAEFRTLEKPNGALTDRGKAYILNGKPAAIERILSPEGAPKEIWKYTNIKKTFIFEDPSRKGNYKLIEHQK